jgi:hypothetical protein
MRCDFPGTMTSPLAGALLAMLAAGPLAAQGARATTDIPDFGSVSGTVVLAPSGTPISGAVVVLDAVGGDALVIPAAGAFLARSLSVVTGMDGAYRFGNLAPGAYRLLVRHLGYRPATVAIDLGPGAPFRVSVALVVNPIRLEPMDARALTVDPYGRFHTPAKERERALDAEAWRDQRFLEGDAAVLTHADVVEAVTLGETDLFRALQRAPGVSTRDDYTAALWTRGAPWGQTRVYFDGQPLFNPVHAVGLFAGVNPDAVGSASFHPGVRSPAIGEGAAGVFDVRSRRAARPGTRGVAELSMVSARAAADWGSPGGRTGVTLAARRSYVDLVTRMAETFGADSGTWIPYSFHDVTARLDADLGDGYAFEASGLLEQDGVDGPVRDLLRATAGHWGNRVARVTLLTPLGAWRARHTAGVSRFYGTMDPVASRLAAADPSREPATVGTTRNDVTVFTFASEVTPAGGMAGPGWSAGFQYSGQYQHYVGQYPRPYPVVVLPDTLLLSERLDVLAVWGERRIALGRRVALEAGLRVETHRPVCNAPSVGVAPKLTLRATPIGSRVTLTAAAARSWQYTQALAPAGPSVGPDLYLTDVWLLAGDTIPALRSDVGTLGVEAWLGGSWIAAANGYVRHATGMAVPEPGAGVLTSQRPIFVSADNRAHGVELSVRRIAGRWTASGSWSHGVSDLEARSGMFPVWYSYPSSADRRRSVDLTAMRRFGDALRVGAAFTWATGAPFSRFFLGQAACDSAFAAFCTPADSAALYIESPNAERTPAYASLDLLVDWSRRMGGIELGAYLQVRNVLNTANAVTYTGSIRQCTPDPPTLVPVGGGVCDRFDLGVPRLPLAGVRVSF